MSPFLATLQPRGFLPPSFVHESSFDVLLKDPNCEQNQNPKRPAVHSAIKASGCPRDFPPAQREKGLFYYPKSILHKMDGSSVLPFKTPDPKPQNLPAGQYG
jgi:hypothetical protein